MAETVLTVPDDSNSKKTFSLLREQKWTSAPQHRESPAGGSRSRTLPSCEQRTHETGNKDSVRLPYYKNRPRPGLRVSKEGHVTQQLPDVSPAFPTLS